MGFTHRFVATVLLACLATAPRLAAADESNPYGRSPPTQKEKLRWSVLMRDGQKLVDEGSWALASGKFSEALKIDAHPEAFLWKGFTEEKLGRLVLAKAMYSEARTEAKESKLPALVKSSEEALAQLTKRIPRVVVHLPVGVRATVSIDDAPLPLTPEGIEVDPGPRSVNVSAPEREPFHVDIKAEEGQVYTFEVALALLPTVKGQRGCGPCAMGSPGEASLPGSLATAVALLLGERRRRRRPRI